MNGPAVDVGLALPQSGSSGPGGGPLEWPRFTSWALSAEELGFSSLWMDDPCGPSPTGFLPVPGSYDPFVALAALARLTRRVRLGTLALCTPLRPPTLVAKALATLDVLAEGRLVAGLGPGADREPSPSRWERLAEVVEVVRGMWGGEPFSYEGRHHRAHAARSLPRPVQQPAPPVWLAGAEDELVDLVARHAEGWHTPWSSTPDEYGRRREALVAACERVGRDPATVTCSVGLEVLVGEDAADLARRYGRLQQRWPEAPLGGVALSEWRRGRLVGTVDEVRAGLAEWPTRGVSTVVLTGMGTMPLATSPREDLHLLAAATLGVS